MEQSVTSFSEFIYQFGLMTDGEPLLQEAVDQLYGQAEHRELLARLLDRHRMFVRSLRSVHEAQAQISADLLLYVNSVESRIHISAFNFQGDFGAGIARLQEMLALLDAQGGGSMAAEEMRIRVLVSLGLVAYPLRRLCAGHALHPQEPGPGD
jgi:hypothetical protein